MPTNWGDNILISNLSDEPELAEELSAVFAVVKGEKGAGGGGGGGGVPHVVLNMGGVSFLSSSHLAQLLRMRAQLSTAERALVLCALTENAWSVLMVAGLDKVFRVAPDTATALAGLQIEDQRGEEA